VGSFLDNTLQKQTATALLEAKAAAEKANQAKSRFLAAASHDLRQPLAALSLYVDVLNKKDQSNDRGVGKKIQGCVNSLSELLNDLLDVSKLDAGVVKPKLSDFRINDLLQAMVTMHSPEAALKSLRLRMRPSDWIGRTDFQIMQRILGNLVFNAIRYTKKGGIFIGCRHYQGKQWIEVWDTGIGIPENKTDSIFEEFTQLDDARNRGSGLGLAIVNKSAKLLCLQVRVRSRPGHGSMFAIEIPQGKMIPVEETPIAKPPSISLKIGLVDDNASVLEAFTFALNSFGYEVIAATSGKELFEQLGNQKLDILISDYRLADSKNGLDLVAEARRLFTYNLPAIIITGDTDPELLSTMAKHGVTVCHKPLKIAALEAVIRELVKPKVAR
jgi:CheY-like chemotaxis protein